MDALITELEEESDKTAVRQARALDGLHFFLFESDRAARIGEALERAAKTIQASLDNTPAAEKEPRDLEFATYLAVLQARLHDRYGPQ